MDTRDLAKVAGALSRPLTKLITVMENGIGAIGRPLMLIINAHAEGRTKLIREGYAYRLRKLKAANRAEFSAVMSTPPALPSVTQPVGQYIEAVFDEAEPTEALAVRIMQTEQDAKRRANVVTIVAEAADQLPPEVSDEPLDSDWIARFFSHAQDVSMEEMQKLWGKVLAGEVQMPGRFSLRTLDVLRNLTTSEAKQFTDIASFIEEPDNCILFGRASRRHLPDLHRLVDAGLLRASHLWRAGAADRVLRYPEHHLRIHSQRGGLMDAHDVSSAGLELLLVVEKRPNAEFLGYLAEDFRKAGYEAVIEPSATQVVMQTQEKA